MQTTTYHFQYGKTASYGSNTGAVSGAIGPAAGGVTVYLEKHANGRWLRTTRLRLADVFRELNYARTIKLAHGGHYRVLAHVTNGARLSAVSPSLYVRRPRR